MSDIAWTGPLAHRDPAAPEALAVEIADRSDIGVLDLRIGPKDAKARAAASKALGFDLPTDPRSSANAGDVAAYWFSIDQWLITAPRDGLTALEQALADALASHRHALTDVSDMRAILRVQGETCRAVLSKCIPIDMYADEIVPGYVRRVTFGEIAAAMICVSSAPDTFDLLVFRSYADYAVIWLEEAADPRRSLSLYRPDTPPAI